jgi:hypothetical protein
MLELCVSFSDNTFEILCSVYNTAEIMFIKEAYSKTMTK